MKVDALTRLIQNEFDGVACALRITAFEKGIHYKLLSKWSRGRAKIMGCIKKGTHRRIGSGAKIKNAFIEAEIVEWVLELRNHSLAINNSAMAREAIQRYPDIFRNYESCLNWTYRIMDRNLLSIRRKTHDQKNLSEVEMGMIQVDFVEYLRKVKHDFAVPDRMIINMDETGLYFDMQPNVTLALKGTLV